MKKHRLRTKPEEVLFPVDSISIIANLKSMSTPKLWINFSKIMLVATIIFVLARLNFALQNFWRVKIFSRPPKFFRLYF